MSVRWRTVATRPVCHHRETISSGSETAGASSAGHPWGGCDVSIFLYRLGRLVARHRGLVVGLWVLALVGLGGGAAMLGDQYDDSFSIPGTDSQEGQDLLARALRARPVRRARCCSRPGTGKITDQANAAEVASLVKAIDAVDGASHQRPAVRGHPDALNTGSTATLAQMQLRRPGPAPRTPSTRYWTAADGASRVTGDQTYVGGDAYKDGPPSPAGCPSCSA